MHTTDEPLETNVSKAVNYGRRLLQPQYWPQLSRLVARRFRPRPQSTRAETRDRCEAMAVDARAAIQALGFPASALRSFAGDHGAAMAEAQTRVEAAHRALGGAADLDMLYSLCIATKAESVLETGVAFGWSTLCILSAISTKPGARLVSVDMPYLAANADNLVGIVVPEALRGKWTLHRGPDREKLPGAIAEIRPIDFAHYDSDKSYRGRLWAYPLIWEALRPGGFLMSDDIEDNLAFFECAEMLEIDPVIIGAPGNAKFSGVIAKPA